MELVRIDNRIVQAAAPHFDLCDRQAHHVSDVRIEGRSAAHGPHLDRMAERAMIVIGRCIVMVMAVLAMMMMMIVRRWDDDVRRQSGTAQRK